ncbi:MAG: hypothetical protein M9938_10310 [Solirubrobacterales bacterium]|nr:hypothetical protein [Solirubrobacterales bacterium]
MFKVRAVVASIAVALIGAGFFASTAPAADTAAVPLSIKVAPFAGKKVKVARKLKVIVSCDRDCVAKVRITLITPAGNSKVGGARSLPENRSWITGMVLTRFGVGVLRNHFRRSRLKVVVRARDPQAGAWSQVTRTFRFRRQ